MKVAFHALEKLSDPIILGMPELRKFGLYLEPDMDQSGLGWVQFAILGVKLPLIGTKLETKINVVHPALMAGPDFQAVPVELLADVARDFAR